MKCPIPLPVAVAADGFRAVHVGEAGRGRKLVKVPLGREFAPEVTAIEAADLVPQASGRGMILVPERDQEDRRALVLLKDRSGYRGGWNLLCGVLPPAPPSHPGAYDPDPGGLRPARAAMIARDHPTPAAPADLSKGPVWYPAGGGRVAVVAQGECAQGDAGRMGGGSEYLLVLEPGAAMTITRQGRLYGAPARLILSWDGERLTETPWDDYAARAADGAAGGAAW